MTSESLVSNLATLKKIETLEKENQALREALEPFAKACDDCVDNEPDRAHIWEHAAAMEITFGNLRKARTALSKGMR